MKRFEVFVEGIPASQGSHAIIKGRIVQVNSSKHAAWKKAILAEAKKNLPDDWQPFDKAIHLIVHFYVPRGKTVTRKFPTTPIDLDKLVRHVGDSLTQAGIIVDDALIINLVASKSYGDVVTGAKITVIAIE